MPRILVDGLDYLPQDGAHTWAQLLDQIDRTLDTKGLIVTDVVFDGLDEPGFREHDVLERPLDGIAVVDVAVSTPTALVNRCLDDAALSLPALAAATRDVGEKFRGFDISGANSALGELSDGLTTLVSIVATAGGVLGSDLRMLEAGGAPVEKRVDELTHHIAQLLDAQKQQDWLTVADVLEYDVAPALESFGVVLDAFERPGPTA